MRSSIALARRHWPLIVGSWTIPAVAGTIDNYVWRAAYGHPISLLGVAAMELPGWTFWVAMTPVIFWLTDVVPLRPMPRMFALLVHLAIALAISAAHALIVTTTSLEDIPALLPSFRSSLLFHFGNFLPVTLLAYAAIVGLRYGLDYYEGYHAKELESTALSARLSEARLAVLRSQLHPHMIFNSLNAAMSLVRIGDRSRAERVLGDLSDMLRHALRNAMRAEVPLREELEFVQRWLSIDDVRFPGSIQVTLEVDPDLKDVLVPNMILQPLIENAALHGRRAGAATNCMEITATAEGGTLTVVVRDDGPGFGTIDESLTSIDGDVLTDRAESGIGIRNTRERLAMLYGNRAELVLYTRPTGGAEVIVRLPLRMTESPPVSP